MVKLTFVARQRTIDKRIETRVFIYVIPYDFVGSVKDMRAVLMHGYSVDIFRITVAADVGALLHHQTLFAAVMRLARENRTEKPRPDNEKIVLHIYLPPLYAELHVLT